MSPEVDAWPICVYLPAHTCICTYLHPKIISFTTIYEPIFYSDQQSSWKEWFKLTSNFRPSFLSLLESFSGSCICLSILIFLTLQGGIFSLVICVLKFLYLVPTSASVIFFNKPSSWSFLSLYSFPNCIKSRDMICLLTRCPFTDY